MNEGVARPCLGCKGLVDLEDVHVVYGDAGLLQGRWDGEGRADAHELRVHAHAREAAEARDDGQPVLLGHVPTRQEHHGSTVRRLTGVPGRCAATSLESRLQLGKTLLGGASARAFVLVNHHLLDGPILLLHLHRDWHNLLLEPAVLLCLQGLPVGVRRHLVLPLTGDAVCCCHILGRQTHGHQAGLSILVIQDFGGQLGDVNGGHHGKHAHVLHAAGQTNVDDAALDGGCDVGGGLQAAAALAVHRAQGDVIGQLCHELAHAGGEATGTRLEHVPNLDVPNVLGIHFGSGHDLLEDSRQQLFRRGLVERALSGLAQGSAYCTANDHVIILLLLGAKARSGAGTQGRLLRAACLDVGCDACDTLHANGRLSDRTDGTRWI